MVYVRFYGDAGEFGTEYEEYDWFNDDVTNEYLDSLSDDYATSNFDNYGYEWECEEEFEDAFEAALENCGWEFITEEEYEKA